MWTGVTIGFAGKKLSGSISKNGVKKHSRRKKNMTISALLKSFIVKYGWKGILSGLFWTPKGLEDFWSCKKTKCKRIKIKIIKGNK